MTVYIEDPRFEGWETVQAFDDLPTAESFAQQLRDAAFNAELLADDEPGTAAASWDIYLSVPPDQLIDAQDFLEERLEELD